MSTSCPHCGAAMDDSSRFCPVCGRPIPAMQEEATVFVLKPGTACLEETDECISPPAASPPALSRREKRIARKLRHMAFEESASEDYIDPITPPKQRWKIHTELANNSLTLPDFLQNRYHDKSPLIRVVMAIFILIFFM